MKRAVSLMLFAGVACVSSAEPLGQPEVVHAQSATKIVAMRTDGSYVLGETIHFGDVAARGNCEEIVFDQLSGLSECSFGDVYPQSGVIQSAVEDFVAPGGQLYSLSGFSLAALRPLCDGGTGTTAEELHIVLEMWDGLDNVAQLDGTDGFASGTPGLVTPMYIDDLDGDTLIDFFRGGVILTYADTDTDGDTVNDAMLSSGASGYTVFSADGLDPFEIVLSTWGDFFDGSGGWNFDGIPDGGLKVTMTRGDGGDGNGPLANGFYPSTNSRLLFGATAANDPSGCLLSSNLGNGSSTGTLWAEGYSECNGGPGWSDGSASGGVDDLYDPNVDVRDLDGAVAGLDSAGIAISICAFLTPIVADCCDINGDAACTPADFSAWLNAFGNSLRECDVNQDSLCSPADFTAWVNAYNNSRAGTPLVCEF
ncbi:MAG: hypothetical protein Phyf2KO_12170 [Phycisphaerales bacterium]